MKILRLDIDTLSDFHTTGTTRGSFINILRDHKDRAIIPGSHIKGVVRTEAERIISSIKEGMINDDEIVEKLFGYRDQEGGGGDGYKESKLRFLDAIGPSIGAAMRTHVALKRESQTKREHALNTEVVISKGSKFTGAIICKDLTEDERSLLNGAIRSATHYGLGGGRSRGLGLVEISVQEIDEDGLKIIYMEGEK